MKKIFLIAAFYAAAIANASAQNSLPGSVAPGTRQTNAGLCWTEAAAYHKVDPYLLYSIAYVESGFKPGIVGKNRNGSVDMGLMQINSIWLPTLARYGIPQNALFDPCASIYIGAWILSKNIAKYGYTWRAIGAYNSANPTIGYRYAQKVYQAHARFTGVPTQYAYMR